MNMKKKVRKQAKKLDRIKPNWYKKIDIKTLNMQDSDNCILGQVFKKEARQTKELWCYGYSYAVNKYDLHSLAFDGYSGSLKLWKKEIKKRSKK